MHPLFGQVMARQFITPPFDQDLSHEAMHDIDDYFNENLNLYDIENFNFLVDPWGNSTGEADQNELCPESDENMSRQIDANLLNDVSSLQLGKDGDDIEIEKATSSQGNSTEELTGVSRSTLNRVRENATMRIAQGGKSFDGVSQDAQSNEVRNKKMLLIL